MKPKLKPAAPPLTDRQMAQTVARELRAPFRGEIWDFFKDVPMGRGLVNQGKPFDINTAFYMTEIMREIRRRPYGKFVIKAGIQMLKTHCSIELPAGYLIANNPGDMILYFPGDQTAFDQAKSRTMDHLLEAKKASKRLLTT